MCGRGGRRRQGRRRVGALQTGGVLCFLTSGVLRLVLMVLAVRLLYVTMYVALRATLMGREMIKEARQGLEVRGIRGKRRGAGKEVTGLRTILLVRGGEETGTRQNWAVMHRVELVIRVVPRVAGAATPAAGGGHL